MYLSERSKLSHSFVAGEQPGEKRSIKHGEELIKTTEKKRAVQVGGYARLETLVEQNKFLLVENNQMANVLNQRNRIITALQQKLQQQIAQQEKTLQEIEFEKNRFLQQYSCKMREHNLINQRLLSQISQLNSDIYQLQLTKKREIDHLKQAISRDHKLQIDNLLLTHAQTLQIHRLENAKLKETISHRDNSIECINHQLRSTNQKLKNKSDELQKSLNHVSHMKKLQLSQQKIYYEKLLDDTKRDYEKKQEIAYIQHDNQLKKIKKQLLIKQVESEKLANDISANRIDTQIRINQLVQENQMLQSQIEDMTANQKQILFEEMQRITNLTKKQIESSDNLNQQMIDNLQSQNLKLAELNQTKALQLTKLSAELQQLRQLAKTQVDDNLFQIQTLKTLLHTQHQSYLFQNQAMKIKLAQLRSSDLQSLQQYYQNELTAMSEELVLKDEIIRESREKIHAEIQEKTEMRNQFEIQINQLMIKIGHLENKMDMIVVEKEGELANVGSQMNMTSISLMKETGHKEKYAISSQEERERLQKIIEGKDKEIDQLNQQIRLIKNNHSNDNKNREEQLQILKKTIEDLQANLKKQKTFFQNEIKKKDTLNKDNKEFYQNQINRVKKEKVDECNKLITDLNNQKNTIDEQRIRLKKLQKQLTKQLKQQKQFRQQQNIDKQLTLHQSMSRMNTEKQFQQKSLKQYFQKQKDARDKQIKDLKQQIAELNADVRLHIDKEQKLEEKIRTLLESQEKLRDMEQRVIALGQDNNLIKNLSEIVKNRRK